MMKKNDLILIGSVIIICAAIFIFMNLTKKEGSEVLVTVNGKEYEKVSIKEDKEFTVELDNGAYNTFKISDGKVDMIAASCPDKLCVKHKAIQYNNETIVCLPNKVVLQVVGGEESEVDMIAN